MSTSTHNLCFRAKIRKMYTLYTADLLIKMGFKGVQTLRTCYHDANNVVAIYGQSLIVHVSNSPDL